MQITTTSTGSVAILVGPSVQSPALLTSGPYLVTKVVDGDTLWVQRDGQQVKLRLEHLTDRLALRPLLALDATERAALLAGLREPVRLIVDAGMVPTWELRERLWRDLPPDVDG